MPETTTPPSKPAQPEAPTVNFHIATAAIVRTSAEEILLVKDSRDSKWKLPAGLVRDLESNVGAAQRVLQETTSLDIPPLYLATAAYTQNTAGRQGDITLALDYIFGYVPRQAPLRQGLNVPVEEYGWYTVDKAIDALDANWGARLRAGLSTLTTGRATAIRVGSLY